MKSWCLFVAAMSLFIVESNSFDDIASSPPNYYIRIQSTWNELCLNILDASATNGSKIVLSECNGKGGSLWDMDEKGFIRSSFDSDKCIQIRNSTRYDKAPVEIQICVEDNENQMWKFATNGQIQTLGDSRYCMDKINVGNVVAVGVHYCNKSLYQNWRLILPDAPNVAPTYIPITKSTSTFVPSSLPSTSLSELPSGTYSKITPSLTTSKSNIDSGKVIIKSIKDRNCLAPPHYYPLDGDKITLSSCTGDPSQIWSLDDKGFIRSYLNRDKCLKVAGSLFMNTSLIEIDKCDSILLCFDCFLWVVILVLVRNLKYLKKDLIR